MHKIADQFILSSGRCCALYRIQRDLIPDYYLLTFPRSDGEPPPADLAEMLVLGSVRHACTSFLPARTRCRRSACARTMRRD